MDPFNDVKFNNLWKSYPNGMNPFRDKGIDVDYIWQPYQTFLSNIDGKVNVEYFDQFKKRLVVINFASEHWNNTETGVLEQLKNTDINFILLTHDPKKHQTHPRIFYFPHWYDLSRNFFIKKITNKKDKNYSIGCLNGNASPHRIANYLKLKKQPYWDKICINLHKDSVDIDRGFQLTSGELEEWETIKLTLPDKSRTFTSVNSRPDFNELNVPQLLDSYLHLITETSVLPSIFISEKTWKPIATAMPFILWGSPNSVNFLKSQGVDVYDDVIDHKYYDSEEDARIRLDKLHDVIRDLIAQGADNIYNQLLPRAITNQTRYFQGEFCQEYLNSILDEIKKYS